MKGGTIYALADPKTEEIRYVGQTTRSPRTRLGEHLAVAQKPLRRGAGSQRRLRAWLRSLQEKPLLIVLEETTDLDDAEQRWIAQLRGDGARLCNMTEGGDGFRGLTDEGRRKQEEGRRRGVEAARDPEVRARAGRAISAAHIARRGEPRSEAQVRAAREHSERMRGEGNSFYGRSHGDETKGVLREKRKTFRHTPESRAKISESLRIANAEGRCQKSAEGRASIAETRRREWADPEIRALRIAQIRAGQERRR